MLGKIENIPKGKYRNFDFLLNLLISVIKREFYSDSKRPTSKALESSLNKANLYLADFAEKGNIEWIGNLSFICGVFSKNILYISQVGNPIVKLFRETTISHIEKKFPSKKKPHPLKTFNNIANGTLLNGDKIVLSVKDILDIVPLTNLKEFSKGSCYQIIENFRKIVENKTPKTPIICLVLEAKTEAPEEVVTYIPIKKVASDKNLMAKRVKIKSAALKTLAAFRKVSMVTFKTILLLIFVFKKTYKLLTPVLLVACLPVRQGRQVFRKISKTGLPRQVKAGFYKLLLPILSIGRQIFLKIKHVFLNLLEQSGAKEKYGNFKTWIINLKNYKITTFYQQNKPAFLVASLLVILVLVLPFATVQKINYHVKTNNFNRLSAEIQEIQKKAGAALIYQDKEKAKGLLQKNQDLLASLLKYSEKSPFKNNGEILNEIAVLQEKHRKQQDSINNVKRMEKLVEVLDFSTSGFIVNPAGINKIENNLYFYEFESGILYKFPTDGKLTLIFISAKDELRKMAALENSQIVLFGQSGKIYLYDSNANEHSIYLLDPPIAVEKIKDVKSYLSNFYILDAEQGNIIKFSLASIEENAIKGTNWLLESPASLAGGMEELKNAKSMTIDGSIYILNSNNMIIEYLRGKKVKEIQPLLEKPLAEDNRLFTKINFINFYISDPENKRLIVLNKDGKIINQYINDELADLQDFWVTEDEKEIYLLCGKKVFKIDI